MLAIADAGFAASICGTWRRKTLRGELFTLAAPVLTGWGLTIKQLLISYRVRHAERSERLTTRSRVGPRVPYRTVPAPFKIQEKAS